MAGPNPPEGDGPSQGNGPDSTAKPVRDDSPGRDESLGRDHRLRRRVDYLRCYRRGRRRHGSLATVHFHDNQLRHPRLGITASRKVGKSVVRQRAKRRVREIFRRWPGRPHLARIDIVVHLKPSAAQAPFPDLKTELETLLSDLPRRTRTETAPLAAGE